jgi:hypothetical protein
MTNVIAMMGGVGYDWTTEITLRLAPSRGVDRIMVFDDVWLEAHPLRQVNRALHETKDKRGLGWFWWKPLLVFEAFKTMADGDVCLLLDADTYPASAPSLLPLFDLARRDGIVCFDCSGRLQKHWCRRDAYICMAQDEPKYHESQAGCARFGLFKKGDWRALQFLIEWWAYNLNPLANTREKDGERDVPSKLGPELPDFDTTRGSGFCEHRTEQAIYTLLAHKYGVPLQPEASAGNSAGPGLSYFEQSHDTSSINPGVHCKHFNVPMP